MRQINIPNALDDLVDVDLHGAKLGQVLTLDADRTWRAHDPLGKPPFAFDYLYDPRYLTGEGGFIGGFVRFDAQDATAATTAYLGNGNQFGQGDPNVWIQSWDNVRGARKGYLTFHSATDPMGWLIFAVLGVTDDRNWKAVELEHLDHQNNPCVNLNDRVTMSFFMAGDSA